MTNNRLLFNVQYCQVHLVAMEPTEHQELQEHKDPQDLQESLVLKERLEYLAKITMLAAQKENLEMTEHRVFNSFILFP